MKHQLSSLIDYFYKLVSASTLFWWHLLKHALVYGVLDGLFAMMTTHRLKLEKKQGVSFCWFFLVMLTTSLFLLIHKADSMLVMIFLAMLILTSLATIYMYEIIALVSLKKNEEEPYQVIYAQAFLNVWRKIFLKMIFVILGLALLKFNLILFIFVFPKAYQLWFARLNN